MEVRATKDKKGWIKAWLDIWSGMLGLTERELELTALIVARQLELSESVLQEDLLAELLLNTSFKNTLRSTITSPDGPMSPNNLQNYLAALKRKGVLRPIGDKFLIRPTLLPEESITFHFTVTDEV